MRVDASQVRVVKADLGGTRLEVTCRVFNSAGPVSRKAIVNDDAFSSTPLCSSMLREPTVVTARVEADLGKLAAVSDPRSLTFYVAFIRALEEAKSRRRGSGDIYQVPVPIHGRVISNARTKDRKRRQDLVDKRNKQLSEKIRNVKGVLDFRHIKAPRHCHTAIIRRRGQRAAAGERQDTTRFEDIYKTKESRLANFGVKGKVIHEEMRGRTALYDDDGPRQAWSIRTSKSGRGAVRGLWHPELLRVRRHAHGEVRLM